MRLYRMRYDIWLSAVLACLVGWCGGKVVDLAAPAAYSGYAQQHTVQAGEIGGEAGGGVYRAQNVQDLLSHDTFTVVSPGIEYRNRGAGYYGSIYLYSVTLPSGERVAAAINMDAVRTTGQDIYSGDSTLPVGRIVYEDLAQNESFLRQIETKEPLARTDFYVDMMGQGGKVSEERYSSGIRSMVQVLAGFLSFPLFHALGAKLGVFPYFFPPRKKKEPEWE